MSSEYGRMEAADIPAWFRRYEAVRWSLEFIDRSTTELGTPPNRQTPWLSLIARLKQLKPLEGDYVTRNSVTLICMIRSLGTCFLKNHLGCQSRSGRVCI